MQFFASLGILCVLKNMERNTDLGENVYGIKKDDWEFPVVL